MQPNLIGEIDFHNSMFVKGWALQTDALEASPEIQVFEQTKLVTSFVPMIFRWDLYQQGYGNGEHGFIFPVNARYLDGQFHELHFRFKTTGEPLDGSPVIITATSESQHIPFQVTDMTGRRVLVLAPHPDDETLACGGTLILHRRHGDAVKVVFLTDGSKADTEHTYPPADYIRLRYDEARQATKLLGIDDLEFWDIPDRELIVDVILKRMVELLQTYQPELIYLPSALDFHPDHRATAALLWRAIQETRTAAKLAFYDYNRPINVNTLVNITAVVEIKRQACNAYQSQIHYYPYTDSALAYNKYRALTVSAQSEYVEDYFLLDSQEILEQPIEFFTRRQFLPQSPIRASELPLVSVITRTKNRPHILREALSSLLTQTYPNVEVIVINDGGSDVSEVLDEFRAYISIQYRALETSIGRTAAANLGVSLAHGKYVNFLDDDDLLYATHLEKLVGYLEATGDSFAYSDCERGYYQWNGTHHTLTTAKTPYMGINFDRDRLYLGNFIPIMTAMFTPQLWEKAGRFDEAFDVYEDWDLWLRMCQFATPQRLPGITAEYRVLQDRRYDESTWTLKVYRKYADYWTLDNLSRVWQRLDDLQWQNRSLKTQVAEFIVERNRLADQYSAAAAKLADTAIQLADTTYQLSAIYGSRGWRLVSRFLRVGKLVSR